MTNAYIDAFQFARATTGLEYQSLVGNLARFTSAQTASASSLTVPSAGSNSITVPLNQFDHITIFDGPTSEVVQVASGGAAVGATTIPLVSPLQYNHSAGVAWCSDGVLGSLADDIFSASQWLETICRQSLFQTTYTSEILRMPTMRAALANDGVLHFRPRHFPIATLSSLTINTTQSSSVSYDTAQVFIDGDRQVCELPQLTPVGGQSASPLIVQLLITRQQSAWITINYTAGYGASAMPADVTEAAILLTSDVLAKRLNPMGATEVGSGGRHIAAVLRGDNAGESLLYKRAFKILNNYTVQPF